MGVCRPLPEAFRGVGGGCLGAFASPLLRLLCLVVAAPSVDRERPSVVQLWFKKKQNEKSH